MKTQGRKNVHGKGGVRFKAAYTKSKYESMLRTLVTDLIVKESITCTLSTARDLSALADKLVTLGKRGDLHARRLAAAQIRDVWADEKNNVTALQKLFGTLALAALFSTSAIISLIELLPISIPAAILLFLMLIYIPSVHIISF